MTEASGAFETLEYTFFEYTKSESNAGFGYHFGLSYFSESELEDDEDELEEEDEEEIIVCDLRWSNVRILEVSLGWNFLFLYLLTNSSTYDCIFSTFSAFGINVEGTKCPIKFTT